MALSGAVALHFEKQAQACDWLGSPFTAILCRLLAERLDETTGLGRGVAAWPGSPGDAALALRLCGGLHRLVLSGADAGLASIYPPNRASRTQIASALEDAVVTHEQALTAALSSAPQTNEIARSAMLLPGFLAIARETGMPLSLCEIGASAGLNLLFDRFGYRYGDARCGDAASPVQLAPEVRGPMPPLDGGIAIAGRHGCDIAPVDVSRASDRLRLRSYVWADQPARQQRLNGAMEVAARTPFSLVRADAAEFVARRLAALSDGSVLVVFHSIMWQYMPRATKEAILASLATAGGSATRARPLARLRMEPLSADDGWATLSLTMWPGEETRRLAKCDFHGRWMEWL